ncbi:MAG: hypothetical protein A4E72_02345 [Syntrophus sp. PtaU1.Bin208]|nr:MAG: hypothetical protein A4E72_02345 [Syntrophus sp. PtaU1.Bin208]
MMIFWLKTMGIGCVSLLFLFFGIDNLVNAYSLKDPHMFVVYFFSSNLMILISLSGLFVSLFRIFTFIKNKRIKPL